MAKVKSKYSPEMVDLIQGQAPFSLEKAIKLAEHPVFVEAGISPRGLIAKARTLGVAYQKQERLTKTGEPVMRKDALVAELEALTGLDGLDSLAKADKASLKALVVALTPRSVQAA